MSELEDLNHPYRIRDRIFAVLLCTLITLALVLILVQTLETYGVTLFLISPVVATSAASLFYIRLHPLDPTWSFLVGLFGLLLAASSALLFGLEGVFCIAMAVPFAVGGAFLGSLIGQALAPRFAVGRTHFTTLLVLLPLLAAVERSLLRPDWHEVVTAIEIDAPPEQVWPYVTGYSILNPPHEWFFRAGIGYPQRVWMEGIGVGATRYCGFSTGTYVEPITAWEPPYRLRFDVTNTPPAMKELSFYEHVHAPHLDRTPRNRRGEFRLTRLPGNRTRMEGSTWYEIDMYPQAYWQLWADATVHAVHQRVFAHIKQQAEKQ